jgi:hypothetical protein
MVYTRLQVILMNEENLNIPCESGLQYVFSSFCGGKNCVVEIVFGDFIVPFAR